MLAAFPTRALAQSAAADPTLTDAVELKNGGYLRGMIVEVDPANHVSIRLPDGQVRRIPVAEIEEADRDGKPINLAGSGALAPAKPAANPAGTPASAAPLPAPAATPGTPAPAPGAPAPAPAAPAPAQSELDGILAKIPGPRVHIEAEATRTAFLERLIGEPDEDAVGYHLVCKLPCRVDLPAADLQRYRIANLRMQPTDWFRLPKYDARLHADLASDMYPIWERSMLIGGFVFGAIGGSFLGINELSGKKEWARDTGFVLVGIGGAFLVTSGIFWLFSPRTSYSV
ncbi:MAG TPA: hypothetical protein VMI54_25030, partial [Polyangiaceae bacterium]|nr:hypothetical protein [Polyangiaceae bacterium]